MEKRTNVDLVLPCYNPPTGWEQGVIGDFEHLCTQFGALRFHLFIVTDGSQRGYEPETVARLKEAIPDLKIVDYQPNRGKGYALREAVRHTTSPYILYTDYDFPYTDESVRTVIDALLGGADVVVAVRDTAYQHGLPRFRRFLSNASHRCNRLLLRLKITDTQGGLKGFNRRGREVFLSTTICSFLFDTEFIAKSSRRGLRIEPVASRIKEGLLISDMGIDVLRREMLNFLKILFAR